VTITGTVTKHANDEVIADATVILSRSTGGGGGLTVIDTTTTNASGVYTFTDVPALDNYVIDVEAAGFFPGSQTNVDLAGMDQDATATENFSLQEVITATITGTITNQDNGEVIAGANVVLGEHTGFGMYAVYTPITSTTTDASGVYTFTDVPTVDNYYVEASADGFLSNMVDNIDLAGAAPDTTVTVDLALGFITTGDLHVFVLDAADDSPMEGASVAAALEGQNGQIYTGVTDEQGLASFEGILTGDYTVTATTAGYLTATQARELTEDENDTMYVLLTQGTGGSTLSGTVSDASGDPVEGAEVVLQAVDGGTLLTMTATTGSDGAYSIEGILPGFGNASLTVNAPGYDEETVPVDLQGTDITADVTLTGSSTGVEQAFRDRRSGFDVVWDSKAIHFEIVNSSRIVLYNLQGQILLQGTYAPGRHTLSFQPADRKSIVLLLIDDGIQKYHQKAFIP
jgi:hypothetical protein